MQRAAVLQGDEASPRAGRDWQLTGRVSGRMIARTWRSRPSYWRASGRERNLELGLGVAALILALVPGRGSAQDSGKMVPDSGLTLAQVRAFATAKRTERAGWQFNPSMDTYKDIYVPPQCVGTRRCPLLIGGGSVGATVWVTAADKYGFIVSSPRPLRELLATFAIDPDKIAVAGDCGGMPWVMAMVANNPDVFSRAVMTTGPRPPATGRVAPPTGRTEFYIDHALMDGFPTLVTAHQLQRAGHPVTVNVSPRAHGGTNYEYHIRVGQWLAESWTIPDPAARPAPDTVAEVELTVEALGKLTSFWSRFLNEFQNVEFEGHHEALWTMVRLEHQRVVALPYPDSELRPVMRIMDVPTMAARFKGIAGLLESVGLTAQQHDEYRIAVFNAFAAWNEWRNNRLAVSGNSVLGKNVAFIDTHPDEVIALESTFMFVTP